MTTRCCGVLNERAVVCRNRAGVRLDVDDVRVGRADDSGLDGGVFFVFLREGKVGYVLGVPSEVAERMAAQVMAMTGRCCADVLDATIGIECVADLIPDEHIDDAGSGH